MFTDNPQFANVYPSLVSELHDFHGHIKAQIQNAMRNGEELFAGTPMVINSAPTVRHRLKEGICCSGVVEEVRLWQTASGWLIWHMYMNSISF